MIEELRAAYEAADSEMARLRYAPRVWSEFPTQNDWRRAISEADLARDAAAYDLDAAVLPTLGLYDLLRAVAADGEPATLDAVGLARVKSHAPLLELRARLENMSAHDRLRLGASSPHGATT